MGVTLPNEKVIRLKRPKIQLRKVTKIDRRLYVGAWGGGRASLCPAPTIKFRDFDELYLRWFSTNQFQTCPCQEFNIKKKLEWLDTLTLDMLRLVYPELNGAATFSDKT